MSDETTQAAHPVFLCECCGSKFVDTKIVSNVSQLRLLLQHPAATRVGSLPDQIIHKCNSGGFGVARLVGVIPPEVVEKMKNPAEERPSDVILN